MAPLDTFMRLHATNGVLVLPEYAFALCKPGAWPFPSTMDINILPEACLAYDTPADSENPLEDPANTDPDTHTRTGKRHHRHKGKSKNWSKSARAASSASEMGPGIKTRLHTLMQHWSHKWPRTYNFHLMDHGASWVYTTASNG